MSWGILLLLVFGGALALEGLGWAVAPDGMRRAYDEIMRTLDTRSLSLMGLVSFTIGMIMIVAAIWLAT